MKKRAFLTLKCYDYASESDFQKDIPLMAEKGYALCTWKGFEHGYASGALEDDMEYKYYAYFQKYAR